jgi:hypothetical protein
MQGHYEMLELQHEGNYAVFLVADRGILQRAKSRFARGSIPRYPIEIKTENASYLFTEKEFRRGVETWKAIHKLPQDEIQAKKNLILRLSRHRDIAFRLQAAQAATAWMVE